MGNKPDMVKWALAYAIKYDIAVIPLHNIVDGEKCSCLKGIKCASAGKHPRIGGWEKNWSKDPKRIEEWWSKWPDANIGMVTGAPSAGICVVDVDEAVGMSNLATHIKSLEIPISVTARTNMKGQHYFFRTKEEMADKIKGIKGLDFRNFGVIVLPPSQGLAKRYKWEVSLKDVEIPALPDSLVKAFDSKPINEIKVEKKGSSAVEGEPFPPKDFIKGLYNLLSNSYKLKDNDKSIEFKGDNIYNSLELYMGLPDCTLNFAKGSRENAFFSVANALIKAGKDRNFVMETLTRLMFTCHDVDGNFILKKIENAIKRHGETVPDTPKAGQACTTANPAVPTVPLTDRIKEWAGYTTGIFTNLMCYTDLSLIRESDKKNVRKTLGKMADDGVLERIKGKQGSYCKVEQGATSTQDWRSLIGKDENPYYDLKLPLGLSHQMGLYPKGIMVVAGATNSGKTAFAMNIAWLNSDKKPRYLNSEMATEELAGRLTDLNRDGMTFDKFDNVEFREGVNKDFHNEIDPNGLNIIDFLEVNGEFYAIGDMITAIHDKLDKGVAVIFIQKNKSTDDRKVQLGVGGNFSVHKPRIYLSMDFQEITVVKCKFPKVKEEPMDGQVIPFKLKWGTTFILKEEGE